MKRQFKLVVPSFVAIIFCMLLIAGSTFALFTSQASAEISVTSGKVKISAEFKELEVYSAKAVDSFTGINAEDQAGEIFATELSEDEPWANYVGKYKFEAQTRTYEASATKTYHLFANNAADTATGALMEERTLTLKNMTPGDKVKAKLSLANESNVAIKYRVKVNLVSGLKLFEGLQIKLDGVLLQGVNKVGTWTYLEAGQDLADVPIEIILPLKAGNKYQDLTTVLNFTVEAVQGNAATTNETLSTNIKVDKAVDTQAESQTLKDKEELVTVVVPTTALKASTESISLKVTPTTSQYASTIVTSETEAQAYDVKVLITSTTEESTAIKESNSENINVTMFVGTGLKGVKLYHNGQLIDSEYSEETGYITFTTQSFSEYTVVYNKDLVVENETTSGSEIVTYKATEEKGVYTDTNNNPVVVSEQGEIEAYEGLQITKGSDAKYQTRESFKAAFISKPSDYAGYTVTAGSFDQFQDLALLCNEGVTFEGMTIKLTADIDFTNHVWVPFGVYTEKANSNPKNRDTIVYLKELKLFMGSIDGNGHKLINFSNHGYQSEYYHSSLSGTVGSNYGLIAVATGNIEIKDLEVQFNITKEGEQSLSCVGIIGHYFSQELTPLAKHYYDEESQTWKVEYNERYNETDHTYEVMETTVYFKNVKTSGTIEGTDAISAFIGTTYISNNPYVFDDNAVYAYRDSKNYIEGPGQSYDNGGRASTIEELQSFATSGWYAEGMQLAEYSTGPEMLMMYKGTRLTWNNDDKSAISAYAPIFINFKFENCTNTATIYSGSRAAVFMGKVSNTMSFSQYNITFTNCTNSANVYSEKQYSGIIAGYFSSSKVNNLDTYQNGLTNTGSAFINYGTANQAEHTGTAALIN